MMRSGILGIINKLPKSYKKISLYEDKMENIEYIRRNGKREDINFYIVTPGKVTKVK